jgi:hypothetical protein
MWIHLFAQKSSLHWKNWSYGEKSWKHTVNHFFGIIDSLHINNLDSSCAATTNKKAWRMSYLSNLVAFLSVNTLTKSQNINPKHPIHDESPRPNIGLISHQPPTINLQKPVGLKYSPPSGSNQHPPPPPPRPVPTPAVRIILPGIPHLHSPKSPRHPLRPPPKI